MKDKTKKILIVTLIIGAIAALSAYVYKAYKAAQGRNAAIRKWLNFGSYIDPATGELDVESVPSPLSDFLTKYENSPKIAAGTPVADWVNGHIWWYQTQDFKNPLTKFFVIKTKLQLQAAQNENENE